MQTEMMEIGQMLCIFAFLLFKNNRKLEEESGKPKAPLVFCFVYLTVDIGTNVLELMAINFLSGSVYSITGSIVIVSTAIFSKIIMKTIFSKSQILGCIFVMMGVAVTAIGEQIDNNSQ